MHQSDQSAAPIATAALRLASSVALFGLASLDLAHAADIVATPPNQDIWTTSVYSFAQGGGGPGGGLADQYLKVGGWGDLYYSLLQFNLTGLPTTASNVELHLYSLDPGGGTPTGIYLNQITQQWNWQTQGTGSDRLRLWWADKPTITLYDPNPLPSPTVDAQYSINITSLYNGWQNGTIPNYGVELQPVGNNNNFDFFASSRYPNATLQPSLLIQTTTEVSHSTFVTDFHSLTDGYVAPGPQVSQSQIIQSQQVELGMMTSTLAVANTLGSTPKSNVLEVKLGDLFEVVTDFVSVFQAVTGEVDPVLFVPLCGNTCGLQLTGDHTITASDFRLFDYYIVIRVNSVDLPLFDVGNSYIANSSILGDSTSFSKFTISSIDGNDVTLYVNNITDFPTGVPEPPTMLLFSIGIILGISIRFFNRGWRVVPGGTAIAV
jgi:hypothetical protein